MSELPPSKIGIVPTRSELQVPYEELKDPEAASFDINTWSLRLWVVWVICVP